MDELLIVDGYNIIHAWDELKTLSAKDLEWARSRLTDMLCNYVGFSGQRLMIVFDAHQTVATARQTYFVSGAEVVFTAQGETADHFIERTVSELRNTSTRVVVATSDALEQSMILRLGATRLSAQGLFKELKKATGEAGGQGGHAPVKRSPVERRLPEGVYERLERMRRGKN